MMKQTFAVIGAGNGGQAMAAHLTLLGHDVRLFDTDREKIRALQEAGAISVEGKIEGTAKISRITADIAEAVEGCSVIFVATTTDRHSEVAESLLPHIQEGQMVLLCPGQTGGTIVVRNIFQAGGKQISVAETQDLIYTCRAGAPGKVTVSALKKSMDMAAYHDKDYDRVIAAIGEIYPQMRKAPSVLHTGFDNMGAILHPAPTLLNAGRTEAGEDFLYYREGITPAVAAVLEAMDRERLAVAAAYGIAAASVAEWQKSAYGVEGKNFYELFQNNGSYAFVKANKNLNNRYITEDVPCGLVPIAELGRLAGVATPVMEGVTALAGALLGRDFQKEGRNLKALGLEGKTAEEIKKMFLG